MANVDAPKRVLVFEPLLPRDLDDVQPCTAWFETTGRRGDELARVTVVAWRVAREALRGHTWATDPVRALVAQRWDEVHLPDEPLAHGLLASSDAPLWTLDDLGPLQDGILGNGLEVSARRGACHRLGHLDVRSLTDEAIAHQLAHVSRVHLFGADCWDHLGGVRRLLRALRDAPDHTLTHIELSGPVSATAIAESGRALARLHRGGQPTVLRLTGHPDDAWADAAWSHLDNGPSTGAELPSIRQAWQALGPTTLHEERLLRLLDDAPRMAALHALIDQPRVRLHDVEGSERWQMAVDALGAPATWAAARERLHLLERPKMVLIPTWQCELRCVYCTIPKQGGREMTPQTAERAVELLLSTDADDVLIHFFGGEPLLNFPVIQHTLRYASERGAALGRNVRFQITSNAFSATDDKLDWLADYPVRFELSLDGDRQTQTSMRKPWREGDDTYANSPAHRARDFLDRGFEVDTIMVVHKSNAERLLENFWHLEAMGYPSLQINFAYGNLWSEPAKRTFAKQLFTLGTELQRRWRDGSTDVQLVNLGETLREVRTNGEVTVDWDGTLYGSNSFLYTPAMAKQQRLGHLDDPGVGVERYLVDGNDADHVMQYSYRPKVSSNNVAVGEVLTTFVRWMHAQGITGPEHAT